MKATALFVLLLVATSLAGEPAGPLTVRIERTRSSIPGWQETISIYLSESSPPLKAFQFLIAYDPRMVTYEGCSPGDLTAEAGWSQVDCHPIRLYGLHGLEQDSNVAFIEIEGDADHADGTTQIRDSSGEPRSLVDLKFMVPRDGRWDCLFSPIRFVWFTPDDNLLWFADAESPANCIMVRDHDSWIHNGDTTGIITGIDCAVESIVRYGGPCRAINQEPPGPPAVFWNGGISISECDGWSGPNRGDLDADGYLCTERDLSLLAKYLIRGNQVFDIAFDAQAGGADANMDNVSPSVADLVYIALVVSDQLAPLSDYRQYNSSLSFVEDQLRLKPWLTLTDGILRLRGSMMNTVTINWSGGLLTSDADTTLGAIWALFELPDTTAVNSIHCLQDMALDYSYIDGELRLLFWSGLDDLRRHVEAGKQPLFQMPQSARLKFLQVSDYAGNLMSVTLFTPDSVVTLPLTQE
ncbi:MAG: hypothetical protein ABIJ61_09005 [bacterium]